MSAINEYAIQSELAQAAYGTFSIGLIDIEDLTGDDVEMSASQAARFAEKWKVAAQYNDGTGLSATVFEEISTGAKHLAIRGFEPSANDVISSTLLALGWPPNFNPQFLSLKSHIENVWMDDPAVLQGQDFIVTGHSLGGYLATAVKSSFSQVTEGYIFNAPGVSGPLGNVADSLASVLGLSNVSTDNLWNVRSSEGISIIAGLGYQL
jgi:pimeloyl-ACP methyl ester carboxylesterase